MGLLGRLLGRSGGATATDEDLVEKAECPHATLTARWNSVQDMGDESKATGFVCAACMEQFTREQTEEIRASLRRRLDDLT